VFAHEVAVIGGEDDNRVTGKPARLKLLSQDAQTVIDPGDEPVILAVECLNRGVRVFAE